MIAPEEALARLLALAEPVSAESVPIGQAAGRWTASGVNALRTQPARDLSAMDGYAIGSGDLTGPWSVIGEAAAGKAPDVVVQPGKAARIFTGAPLPDGADTVVIQEDVVRTDNRIKLRGDVLARAFQHRRARGSDFAQGQRLLERGTRISPARIALALMGGHDVLEVGRRVRVAVISTGNELVTPGRTVDLHQIPASNGVMIAAMIADMPVAVRDFGVVADDRQALKAALLSARDHDIILTTGGASVGDHDLVQPTLIDVGARIDFWKVGMRPGKPIMAGTLGRAIVLGLPGNPVSAFVTATLFLKPLIAHLCGAARVGWPQMSAQLGLDLPAVGIRTDFLRAHWRGGRIVPLGGDSGMLVPLAQADALIVRPAGAPAAASGTEVTVIPVA